MSCVLTLTDDEMPILVAVLGGYEDALTDEGYALLDRIREKLDRNVQRRYDVALFKLPINSKERD